MKLLCRTAELSLERVAVVGVLNVTPDSFSDGGLWLHPDSAIKHAVEMVSDGAAVVDVGGESTRPGAEPVPAEEEMRRVLPVIERLVTELDVPISIDTRKAVVAAAALDAGASIVNGTGGEEEDLRLQDLAASHGAAYIVMHSRGTPATMRSLTEYDHVVDEVRGFLERRAAEAQSAGVRAESLVLDPGIGFAKTPEQSLKLLAGAARIVELGHPVLIGTSRKSFIGHVLDLPEGERVEGTAATVAWSVFAGARLVRVHDVRAMVRVVRMSEAIADAGIAP